MIEFTVRDIVRVRATAPAISRARAGALTWKGPVLDVRLALIGPNVIARLRTTRGRGTSVRMEGFEFWSLNHILRREGWTTVRRFRFVADARRFVTLVLDAAP